MVASFTTTLLALAIAHVALSGCSATPPAMLEEQALKRAIHRTQDDLSKLGVNPSDITMIGLYPFRGGNGRPLINYIWARSSTCAGWFVQRVDNPPDIFTLYGCSLDRGARRSAG